MVGLIESLRQHFAHTVFRPGQEDLVRAVLDGCDVLAVMPTGSGKSLGFQLPAIQLTGTTIVLSPLIALMKDQVDDLTRRGIRAAAVHPLASPAARRAALDAARARGGRVCALSLWPMWVGPLPPVLVQGVRGVPKLRGPAHG
jgi:ATP-dependent DNA helicase RecQ